MTTKEIMEIVLGAAAVLVLVVLLVALIAPTFDKDEKTAESYLSTLKKEIAKADDGEVGGFDMMTTRTGETRFFVVYFGDGIRVEDGEGESELVFISLKENKNHICGCYLKYEANEAECFACEDLKYPASYKKESSFVIYSSEPVYKIKKVDGVYEFSK